MQLKIDSVLVPIIWESNATVAALKARARESAITLRATKYCGFEQVGALGLTLPCEDEQITTAPGDVMLYSGNQLVLFFGANTWSYTRLGRIDLPKERIRAILNKSGVTIVLSPAE